MAKKSAKKKVKNASKKSAVKKTSAPKEKNPQKKPQKNQSGTGIEPLGDRVVVRPLSEAEMGTRSPSGIIIPDTVSKEKPEQGIVVAVGPGRYDDGKRVPMGVKAGDRVVFSKYGYDEVKIAGVEYYLVSESSVLAVIND